MALDQASWILPAAGQVYEHREEIFLAWKKIRGWIRRGRSIAFTGMPGVGKTVLHDYLSGKAYKKGYTIPLTSRSVERAMVESTKRIQVAVIPGQDDPVRHQAVDSIFKGKRPVDGIVHVVSNGFIETRSPGARQVLIDNGLDTIDKYRAFQLEKELSDIESTCNLIREAIRKHRKPKWMLIAVTKVDLYPESISQAEAYYSPQGNSRFVACLKQLQSQVGSDNFFWEAQHVCAHLQSFNWNNEKRPTNLDNGQRDYLLATFIGHLESFCEQR